MAKCLVRCDRSGVFYGELESLEGQKAIIKNVRKIYYWDGANCLEELSKTGTKKPSNCKFTVYVDEIVVTDCIQVLQCTAEAIKSIEGVTEWKF